MDLNQVKISLQGLIDKIPGRDAGLEVMGLAGPDTAYMASRIYKTHGMPMVLIVRSTKAAQQLLTDLGFFLNQDPSDILFFPHYHISPFKFVSYHNETAAKRIKALYQMVAGNAPSIFVTTMEGMVQKIIPRSELTDFAELVMVDEEIDREYLIGKLVAGGYTRTAITEEPGDFSVRGGILDIYSPMYPDPVRIEQFGDLVESIRFFSAASQRKLNDVGEVIVLPAREAILKQDRIIEIISRIREQAAMAEVSVTQVREIVDQIKSRGILKGIDSLIPLIYPELDNLFDYIPDKTLFVAVESESLENAALEFEDCVQGEYDEARNEGRLCVAPEYLYLKWEKVRQILSRKKSLITKMLPVLKPGQEKTESAVTYTLIVEDNAGIKTLLRQPGSNEELFAPLSDWIRNNQESGNTTVLVCRSKAQYERLRSLLLPYEIQLKYMDRFPEFLKQRKGFIYACPGRVTGGFVWPDESLAIISDIEIFGAKPRRQTRQVRKPRSELLTYDDLKKGDLVVHVEHGIGEYSGLVKLKLNGTSNDFLLIIYKDGDKLYLPVDRMSMIQKYMGVDSITPVLDKMGGKSWERIKSKVKKSAEKIAGELLKLYAARKYEKGFSFKEFDDFFQNFEAGFPYEETADQLKAIDDVLGDMAKSRPMDRLICGDVGYGKTEVALRASFLAVNNGKQVAVLVPTTVLAEQHFKTFSDRFNRYPVYVECLSRFRSRSDQKRIVNDLAAGKVDVVIGTHRLLSKDVAFKNLGLLVIDEEQRFGVKHKEKIKNFRKTVDVLALTATPIPRTLHLSLMGIRDISVISTPPEFRQAITTYISEFDEGIISDGIRKELDRKGQIFFIHNNIKSIDRVANKLKRLVPEVRLDIAHGRMDEKDLEGVMFRFLNKEIDMLVCTTIVESGLDIPSANTILVNRADRFGLAQMYQLRGRVGRSDEQAYAYLFIPHESTLGKDAQKRLKVLMEHSDLGAGFQIAMSDLKIRGGGTILGASQSGHIAAVGYDMFLKLMENAISELKGEPVTEDLEPEINMKMSCFIPESYISDIDQRLYAYRTLAKMIALNEIPDFKEEMVDRFGPLPEEAANLLLKIILKILAKNAGVKKIDMSEQRLVIAFSQAHQKNPMGVVDMVMADPKNYEFTPDHLLRFKRSQNATVGMVTQTKNILKEIAQHVN